MVGGGFVDGIVFHPRAKGIRYARTDIGGAYRWSEESKRWLPLLDWLGWQDINLMGVESIGLDPSDPMRLYLACGTYTNDATPNGAILRSDNQGKTFQRADVPFKIGANENGRGNGERLAVDPNDGKILFYGTRKAGLWKSVDRAVAWHRVESFPDIEKGSLQGNGNEWFSHQTVGIVSVLFDPTSGGFGRSSSTVYAAVSDIGRPNLYRSQDAGTSWTAVPGLPMELRPTRMALARDGYLYVAMGSSAGPSEMSGGALWRLAIRTGEWKDVTPENSDSHPPFGFAAVASDPNDPGILLASSFYRPGGEEIYRSLNRGDTWYPLMHRAKYDFSLAPYVSKTPIHWLFDVEIDPANSDHAIFTTGYGGYETFDLSAGDRGHPTHWSVMAKGIEESVVLQMATPTSGPPLVTAIGDYGGFVHWDLDKPSPEGNFENPRFGTTTSIACAAKDPRVLVRVGQPSGGVVGGSVGYSLDGGNTWQRPPTMPLQRSTGGRVAVSADGKVWIWNLRNGSYVTTDRGATWNLCKGLPEGCEAIADGETPERFYAISLFKGQFYTSMDCGSTFTEKQFDLPGGLPKSGGDRGDARGGQDRLYASPGLEGDLWIAAHEGLYHSFDTGKTWKRVVGVLRVHAFGFGKAASGRKDPALFVAGVIGSSDAIFRSDDGGGHWVRINDPLHRFGLILQITGDPNRYGRVYIGIHGRGVVYGERVRNHGPIRKLPDRPED
jgi:photosystem II stability/assembly factor-like uncharacterized protein